MARWNVATRLRLHTEVIAAANGVTVAELERWVIDGPPPVSVVTLRPQGPTMTGWGGLTDDDIRARARRGGQMAQSSYGRGLARRRSA